VRLNISLVTPAARFSRSGNRATAVRWAGLLRHLGHRVTVATDDHALDADVMVAVHAWRSAAAIERFAEAHPDRKLVVLLAGTDIYRFQHSHPDATLASMERAHVLIGLHDLVHRAIPRRFAKKLRVIHQSAAPPAVPRAPSRRTFDICVVGHLREEKDPLRAALAARLMPADSRLRVLHLGKAHDESWARQAEAEMAANPRYLWRGELPAARVRRTYARCHAMVISSIMEGGANVVSEAVAAGLPVLASRIDGNVGLLGADYAGYYPVGDTAALAALLRRAETAPSFLRHLAAQGRRRRALFTAARELAAWRRLLAALTGGR
jgi:putative glycosyltransferase (TIGR04348 family)